MIFELEDGVLSARISEKSTKYVCGIDVNKYTVEENRYGYDLTLFKPCETQNVKLNVVGGTIVVR